MCAAFHASLSSAYLLDLGLAIVIPLTTPETFSIGCHVWLPHFLFGFFLSGTTNAGHTPELGI